MRVVEGSQTFAIPSYFIHQSTLSYLVIMVSFMGAFPALSKLKDILGSGTF